MCLADIDMTALEEMNEGVVVECEHCDGSGDIARGHANDPCPPTEKCGACGGKGVVQRAAEPADDERMEEEACSPA